MLQLLEILSGCPLEYVSDHHRRAADILLASASGFCSDSLLGRESRIELSERYENYVNSSDPILTFECIAPTWNLSDFRPSPEE